MISSLNCFAPNFNCKIKTRENPVRLLFGSTVKIDLPEDTVCTTSNPIGKSQLSLEQDKKNIIKYLARDLYDMKIPPFENQKLYEYLSRHNGETLKLINKWYPSDSNKLISKIKSIKEEYVVLLADPGIAQRIDELTEFAKGINTKTLAPFGFRQLFSDYLDKKYIEENGEPYKTYRGLALTEDEARKINQEGCLASSIYKKEYMLESLLDNFLRPQCGPLMIGRSIAHDIYLRRIELPEVSRVLSVTPDFEIAAGVAAMHIGNQNQNAYVLTANPHVLSEIKGDKEFSEPDTELHIGSKNLNFRENYDNIERFIPDFIPADRIIKIEKVENPPKYQIWQGSKLIVK